MGISEFRVVNWLVSNTANIVINSGSCNQVQEAGLCLAVQVVKNSLVTLVQSLTSVNKGEPTGFTEGEGGFTWGGWVHEWVCGFRGGCELK